MQLTVSDEVRAAYPGLLVAVVFTSGFDGRTPWPQVDAALAALEAGEPLPAAEDDPHIASWYAAYRAFGTNPKRERPSVDALRRRLARSGRLPRINPAVDCYNLISVTHGVPAGAFDMGALSGDVTIGFAEGDEDFVPLGEPDEVEHPRRGEVIYSDPKGVLTRHWNHRDADRTKVTEDSADVVFLLETTEEPAFGAQVREAAAALAGRLADRSGAVTTRWISAASPATRLEP